MGPIVVKLQEHQCALIMRRSQIARIILLACLSVSLHAFSSSPDATIEGAAETQIKAAMLYKFLGYTDWPATSFAGEHSPYRIWVLGASHIHKELRELTAGRKVNNRPIKVFKTATIHRITRPHVVFVGRGAEQSLPLLAKLAEQHSFLIVTEDDQGLIPGSTINLRLLDGRIGFDISIAYAQKNNLRFSARLLSVASSIEQGEQ